MKNKILTGFIVTMLFIIELPFIPFVLLWVLIDEIKENFKREH